MTSPDHRRPPPPVLSAGLEVRRGHPVGADDIPKVIENGATNHPVGKDTLEILRIGFTNSLHLVRQMGG
jgi:hypothetical protein